MKMLVLNNSKKGISETTLVPYPTQVAPTLILVVVVIGPDFLASFQVASYDPERTIRKLVSCLFFKLMTGIDKYDRCIHKK
jgi:hypothetical protein